MKPVHLREIPVPDLALALGACGASKPEPFARHLALQIHRRGARSWDELEVSATRKAWLRSRFRLNPLLHHAGTKTAADGTRKFLFTISSGELVETVLIRINRAWTLCVSSQAGCAMGCRFCATAKLGLLRNLTAGEITESVLQSQALADVRVSDVVFMGQGEPLHNYEAVMGACQTLNHDLGLCIGRKHVTISTVGLTPAIHRYTRERQPWRLHLSLHSAVESTRRRLVPLARIHSLEELIEAVRRDQKERGVPWVTLQYVAIPGVNMDAQHVEALRDRLRGLRYILNVIPYNHAAGDFRPPAWAEVKRFTNALRSLGCPVKTRYSAGKQDGMGCGQLSAETLTPGAAEGHLSAPPGIFTA